MPNFEILPIKKYKKEILYTIQNNQIILLTAQTGSGKTTQIPQFLIQAGYTLNNKKIVLALPRKIAAISVAKRVGDQLGCHNNQIAHHVRFNSTVSQHTRVIFMTDGMLVQQLYSDPLLSQFSIVVLDDIHQKSINFQILFGLLKKIMQKRSDLKIIVTSATLQGERIKNFFQKNSKIKQSRRQLRIDSINITGRLYEVKINYLKQSTKNYFIKTFQTIIYIDRQKGDGQILVFLSSVQQIQGMKHMLDSYSYQNKKKLKILPLHAGLSAEEQNQIFQHSYDRKIILSTNIAQSSITIPEVKFVIDSGYVKIKVYDNETAIEKMIVVPCGKSSCCQRAGRAGRVTNGQCYRIFTESAFNNMPQKLPPQIMRVDLSNFILKLKGLGINDILSFQFLQEPPQFNIIKAIDTLCAYELINQSFQLTQKGKRVAELSLNLRNACMLMNSFDPRFGCSRQILMLVSMLEVQRELFQSSGLAILKAKKKVGCKQGDFLTLINMFLKYHNSKVNQRKRVCGQLKLKYKTMEHALKIHQQLISQIKSFNRYASQSQKMEHKFGESNKLIYDIKSSADVYESILRCILTGFFTNIAQIQGDGFYVNIRSKQKLKIHSTSILSVVYPEWIVYFEIVKTNGFYIYNGSQIQSDWIFQLAGHYYTDTRKQQAHQNYTKQQAIQRAIQLPRNIQQGNSLSLVQVGSKKKTQYFKTNILGLKNMKKSKLSFQEDLQ